MRCRRGVQASGSSAAGCSASRFAIPLGSPAAWAAVISSSSAAAGSPGAAATGRGCTTELEAPSPMSPSRASRCAFVLNMFLPASSWDINAITLALQSAVCVAVVRPKFGVGSSKICWQARQPSVGPYFTTSEVKM